MKVSLCVGPPPSRPSEIFLRNESQCQSDEDYSTFYIQNIELDLSSQSLNFTIQINILTVSRLKRNGLNLKRENGSVSV